MTNAATLAQFGSKGYWWGWKNNEFSMYMTQKTAQELLERGLMHIDTMFSWGFRANVDGEWFTCQFKGERPPAGLIEYTV